VVKPRRAAPGHVDTAAARNLGLVYAPTAAGLYGLAALFLLGHKINRASHEDTLRRLAAASDLIAEGEPVGTTAEPT
jgi:hypothetical protein